LSCVDLLLFEFGLGSVPGKGEEHVIEGWPAQPDIADRDSRFIDLAQRPGERGCSTGMGVTSLRDRSLTRSSPTAKLVNISLARARSSALVTVTSMRSPPTVSLSSSAVP
jgi:hypothetical protein